MLTDIVSVSLGTVQWSIDDERREQPRGDILGLRAQLEPGGWVPVVRYGHAVFSVVPSGPSQRRVPEPFTKSSGIFWKHFSVSVSDFGQRRYLSSRFQCAHKPQSQTQFPIQTGGGGEVQDHEYPPP